MSQVRIHEDGGTADAGWGSSSVNIEKTDLHEVLSNRRRIRLLDLLSEENPRDLGTLAEEIAAAETGERPPPRNIRQSVYVTLHQTHLPKLDDLGVVEYDARGKVVSLAEQASLFFEDDEPVGGGVEPFLGLVLAGLLFSLASAWGLPIVGAVSTGTYAVATLVALLVGFAYRLGRDGSVVAERVRDRLS